MSLFSPLNTLIFSSSEPQIVDYQLKYAPNMLLTGKDDRMHYYYITTLSFLFCIASKGLLAQSETTFLFRGKIVDQITNLPLSYANIYNQTTENGTISDADGNFEVRLSSLPASIAISYIGYEDKNYVIEEIKNEPSLIKLKKSSVLLSEIEVSATPKIETISEEKYSIKDFIPFNDKLLILKKYDSFKGHILSLNDQEGREINQLSLKQISNIEGLHQGCLGGLYVLGKTEVQEVKFSMEGILLLGNTIPYDKVINLLLPCKEASKTHVYFQDFLHEGQMVIWSGASRTEQGTFVIKQIADKANIDLLYREVYRNRPSRSAMGNIGKDAMMFLRRSQHDFDNTMRLYYKPLYAPLQDTGKDICIFNHFEQQAEFYNYAGESTHQLPLTYVKNKKWSKQVLHDEIYGTSYIVFQHRKGKALRKFNYEDASLSSDIVIESAFIEQMKVHNNVLYYLESTINQQNKILRKVDLTIFQKP